MAPDAVACFLLGGVVVPDIEQRYAWLFAVRATTADGCYRSASKHWVRSRSGPGERSRSDPMNHFRKKLLRRRRLPRLALVGGILAAAVLPRPAHADAVLHAIRDALREQTGEAPVGLVIPIADGSKKAPQPKPNPADVALTQLSLEQLMAQE